MVYDEGFDITFEEPQKEKINFFTFSKYSLNSNKKYPGIKSKWASHCHSTLIGWFYIGNKHGCFYGIKNNVEDYELATNGEAENKLNVLENSITSKSDFNANEELDEKKTFSTVNIFFEKNQNEESVEPDILDNIENEGNFLESSSRNKMTLTAKFKDHFIFVNKLNSMNTFWKAENYENFSNLTVEELNRYAGRKRASNRKNSLFRGRNIFFGNEKVSDLSIFEEKNFLESSVKKLKDVNNNIITKNVITDVKINSNKLKKNKKEEEINLPEQFLDYKNYMADPRSQVKKQAFIII
jgi:hypothetical protein